MHKSVFCLFALNGIFAHNVVAWFVTFSVQKFISKYLRNQCFLPDVSYVPAVFWHGFSRWSLRTSYPTTIRCISHEQKCRETPHQGPAPIRSVRGPPCEYRCYRDWGGHPYPFRRQYGTWMSGLRMLIQSLRWTWTDPAAHGFLRYGLLSPLYGPPYAMSMCTGGQLFHCVVWGFR